MRADAADNQNFVFRTLNYLGSKLRLLDFIEEHVERITANGRGVCDLFAGSGCVSYKLSERFPVTACDIQHYSTVICDALLQRHSVSENDICSFLDALSTGKSTILEDVFSPLMQIEAEAMENRKVDVLADIVDHGSIEVFRRERQASLISHLQEKVCADLESAGIGEGDGFISRNYGGVYFSYGQAVWIDNILLTIQRIVPRNERSVFLAALLSTASDMVDTVGKHFAQPIKTRDPSGRIKPLVYNKAIRDKTIDVFSLYAEWLRKYASLPRGGHSNRSIQGDYMDCLRTLEENVQTVYADPPYTRDHYSRFYHVLETIARGDAPAIATVKIHGESHFSNGLYRRDRHQSPFCIRSKAPSAFNDMFLAVSSAGRNLLLSYSPYDETKKTHPRVVTMKQLVSWAKRYFKNVEVVSAGRFSHNKLNSSGHLLESSKEAEVLLNCTGAFK